MGWLGFGQVDLISATPVFYKENYIYGPLDPIPATQIVLKKIILSKTSPKACFSHVPNPGRALAAGAGSEGGGEVDYGLQKLRGRELDSYLGTIPNPGHRTIYMSKNDIFKNIF